MKRLSSFLLFSMGISIFPAISYAQEKVPEINIEESAEVFLEEFEDEFQESFFEALKQKGIENYDKATHLFLACKQLEPENIVIDHELAKAYFADKQYNNALEYGVKAITAEPENRWYLNTLFEILQKQNRSIQEIEDRIPFTNNELQENLAEILYQKKNFEAALRIIDKLKKTPKLAALKSNLNAAIRLRDKRLNVISPLEVPESSSPLKEYTLELEKLIKNKAFQKILKTSESALEQYPSQPYFYFAQGYALHKLDKHSEAIELLEVALDFLIDDASLANKIYNELASAYTALGKPEKANKYLNKIKTGI